MVCLVIMCYYDAFYAGYVGFTDVSRLQHVIIYCG